MVLFMVSQQIGEKINGNPGKTGKIKVSASSIKSDKDSKPLYSILGRDNVRCLTDEKPEQSWIIIDFGKVQICPNKYTLKHYVSWDSEALRSWDFEGSVDGITWTLIYSMLMIHN